MSEIVFLLEEESARVMLDGLLPRILPEGMTYICIPFEGKQDLERQLVRRLRGYRVPGAKFVVLRDQDAEDCKVVKRRLVAKCSESGKSGVLVRIACRELESWYLADLEAVEKGMGITGQRLVKRQNELKFVSPDNYVSPLGTLKQIVPSYQKVGGSRAIGPYLDLNNTRSLSFSSFIKGIRKLCVG